MEKMYRHTNPGYSLALWLDGKPILSNGKSLAHFRDTGPAGNPIDRCGIFRSDDVDVIRAVEESKAFKTGHITFLPGPEYIKAESLRIEREKFCADKVKLAESGLFDFSALSKFKENELREFAANMGVDVKADGAKRKKSEILDEIKGILFPGSEVEDEEDDKEDLKS